MSTTVSMKNVLGAVACLSMMAVMSIPSIQQLKQRAAATICAAHLKGNLQAFNVYSAAHDGKLMAGWDRSDGSTDVPKQSPFTMWYYILGEIPPAAAYAPELGGWWNPHTHSYGGFHMYIDSRLPQANPMYHCPVAANDSTNYTTLFPRGMLSYSLMIYSFYNEDSDRWRGEISTYPKLELFTHSASTLLMGDLAGDSLQTNYYNGWAFEDSERFATPHDGSANYVYCDGHVELLTNEQLNTQRPNIFRPYLQQ